MSTASGRLGKQTVKVKKDLKAMGETVKDAAQEALEQVREETSGLRAQGQDKVYGVACACERLVSERPLRSVLVAVGIGWLIGRFWKSR